MLKHDLRQKYLRLRNDLTAQENEIISQKIISQIYSGFDLQNKLVSCFVPIARFNEVNTWKILNDTNFSVAIPLIKSDSLKHILFKGNAYLKPNSWGILEPTNTGDLVNEKKFDFVIVPLLTINNKGFRVGYGKGYYDKFLSLCKKDCKFIGVYQFDVFEKIEDIHEQDIPLHYCVTPNQILTF